MPNDDTLERRVRALERSVTDGETDFTDLEDAAALTDRVASLEDDLADAGDRIADLEAATQALRGYVGNVRSVNEDVEQRADAALAAVDRLEAALADDDASSSTPGDSPSPDRAARGRATGRGSPRRQPSAPTTGDARRSSGRCDSRPRDQRIAPASDIEAAVPSRDEPTSGPDGPPSGGDEPLNGRDESPSGRDESLNGRDEPASVRDEPTGGRDESPSGRGHPDASAAQRPSRFATRSNGGERAAGATDDDGGGVIQRLRDAL